MIRSDLLYEQMRLRRRLPPLQQRLVYLVHARRMRMRLLEMQIISLGTPQEAREAVKGLLEDYQNLLFPGVVGEDANSWEAQAKKLLADEMRKVYRVRRIADAADREAELMKLAGLGGAGAAVAMQHAKDKAMTERGVKR